MKQKNPADRSRAMRRGRNREEAVDAVVDKKVMRPEPEVSTAANPPRSIFLLKMIPSMPALSRVSQKILRKSLGRLSSSIGTSNLPSPSWLGKRV